MTRRAYVGFSTPVGYDYRRTTDEDGVRRGPNPILQGATGLLVLFDEIWFATEDLCPYALRGKPFVRIVETARPELTLDPQDLRERWLNPETPDLRIFDVGGDGWGEFMNRHFDGHPDNHGVSREVFGARILPDANTTSVLADLYIVDRLADLDLTPAGNDVMRACLFPDDMLYLEARAAHGEAAFDLAEHVLTLGSLYDIAGPDGPWHSVIEELREHDFVAAFRGWIHEGLERRGNRETAEMAEEFEAVAAAFNDLSLRKAVDEGSLASMTVDVVRDMLLDIVPGASAVHAAIEAIKAGREGEMRRASAFLASAQSSVFAAYREAARKGARPPV